MAKAPDETVEKRAIAHVVETAQTFEQMTSHLRTKWLRYYDLYRSFTTGNRERWQSKLFIPKAFEVVEKVAPRLTAHNPKFLVVAKNARSNEFVSLLRRYLDFVWEDQRLQSEMRNWAKSMLIYGTAFVKVDWTIKTNKTRKKASVDGEDVELEEELLFQEIPTFKTVDIFDVLVDPREPDIQKGLGLVHKIDNVIVTDLDPDVYFNLDKIKKRKPDREMDSDKKQKFNIKGIPDDANKPYFTVKEYWGLFDPNDDGDLVEYVIAVADDSTLIRYEENPFITEQMPNGFRPLVAIQDQPVPNEFYGIGEIEPIESLQIEVNTLRNQRMDNVNLGINQIWRVDPDSGINPTQVVSKPGQLIFARQGEIEPMFNRDVPVSSYEEENAINRDIQTATGTIDFTQEGGSQGFTNTATGERIRANEANSRYQYKIDNLEMGIENVGLMMLQMASVFTEGGAEFSTEFEGQSLFVEMADEAFEAAANGVDVRVESGSTGFDTIEDRRNNAIALGNIALQYFQAGVPVDLEKSFVDILTYFPNVKNPQEFIGQPRPQQAPEGVQQPENQNPVSQNDQGAIPTQAPTNQFVG